MENSLSIVNSSKDAQINAPEEIAVNEFERQSQTILVLTLIKYFPSPNS